MAYTIVNKFIPESKYKLKAPYSMTPQYITIHNTYNDASARNEIAYMSGNSNVTGYHVAIDDKEAVQAIPFSRNAFHAGDGQGNGNRKSIGIEICYSKSGGPRYYAAEANAAEYVAGVLTQYGWGIDRIKWHRDWSGKHCPHRMIDEKRLDLFKNTVKAHMDGKVNVATKPKPQEVLPLDKQKDAKASASLAKDVARGKELGISDGTYLHRTATREEVIAMIVRSVDKK
ncbi:peptidoglycan recognition protein family protein [Sporosarcina sp. A2]|uniref:peptidoglycan recognition protein family protein n=1 Tax=Sporosarcina sp. A2 TaxID=3393449 RepID=UPI003D7BD796